MLGKFFSEGKLLLLNTWHRCMWRESGTLKWVAEDKETLHSLFWGAKSFAGDESLSLVDRKIVVQITLIAGEERSEILMVNSRTVWPESLVLSESGEFLKWNQRKEIGRKWERSRRFAYLTACISWWSFGLPSYLLFSFSEWDVSCSDLPHPPHKHSAESGISCRKAYFP